MLLFASARDSVGYFDVWTASRASRVAPFAAPEVMPAINTTEEERDPWLSADSRLIVFSRRIGTGQPDIFMATR